MTAPDEEPTPPAVVPDSLVEAIDALDVPELRALDGYVRKRIDAIRVPIEEAIEAESGGEVIDVEDHGAYALVRQHPPNPSGTGVNPEFVELYHVRRQLEPSGEETLHWAYVGDVQGSETPRCPNCDRPIEDVTSACPHCGHDGSTETAANDFDSTEDP